MTPVIQIGQRAISSAEIALLLSEYQMLPQLCRFIIIDEAITAIEISPEEKTYALKLFNEQNQLTSPEKLKLFLTQNGITNEQLEALATRGLKLEKFKIATWGSQVESYFLSNKSSLDKVIYSLIRTQDMEIAQELFFRIQAGEQTFAECAKKYSQGTEAKTGGLLGPVELNQPHPTIGKMLSSSLPGQLLPPRRLEEWIIIVRLEKFVAAQLDNTMRHQILNRLFESWLGSELSKVQVNLPSQNLQIKGCESEADSNFASLVSS